MSGPLWPSNSKESSTCTSSPRDPLKPRLEVVGRLEPLKNCWSSGSSEKSDAPCLCPVADDGSVELICRWRTRMVRVSREGSVSPSPAFAGPPHVTSNEGRWPDKGRRSHTGEAEQFRDRARMHPKVYEAAKSGDFDHLKIISEDEEALFHQTTPKDNNILHVAAQYKQVNFIERLLQCPSGPSLLWQGNCKGDTPLHVAAKMGSYGAVQVLTDLAKSLHWVVEKGQVDACKELLRKLNSQKDTALHCAVRGGHHCMVKLLIEEDPRLLNITNAPRFILQQGHVIVIDELFRCCPDACDIINTKGQTALHAAVIGGQVNAVKYILRMPNLEDLVNEQDTGGNTALHLAALHKQYILIYILARDKRVDRLAANKDHLTAVDIFSAHEEVGCQAAEVYHVLKGSHGMPFYQDWVVEHVKKRKFRFLKKSIIDLQLLVAVLISTVTFAASFTMPGGYDQGMAVLALAGRAAFKAFVISNIAAFGFSILALLLQFDTCFVSDRLQVRYTKVVSYSMYVAILAMVLAFACGTYVVLCRNTGLGIVPFVVSGCLVTMYVIGGFLDAEAPFWWLSSYPRRYVRNYLFDYGIL
ncbi:hypothetical protein NL676_011949 [Syzygium grande]|nr:hypothetical protein NL676_011949 [Syzygium grande]